MNRSGDALAVHLLKKVIGRRSLAVASHADHGGSGEELDNVCSRAQTFSYIRAALLSFLATGCNTSSMGTFVSL